MSFNSFQGLIIVFKLYSGFRGFQGPFMIFYWFLCTNGQILVKSTFWPTLSHSGDETTQNAREMSSNPTNLISNLSKALEGGAKQYIEKRTKIHPAVSWPYDPILGLAGRRPVWPCEDDDGDDIYI